MIVTINNENGTTTYDVSKVKDESIKDTLVDMANYALIALILYEEDNGKKK